MTSVDTATRRRAAVVPVGAAVCAAALLLPACIVMQRGEAAAGADSPSAQESTPEAVQDRELSLVGVDPCDLFTDVQLAELGVTSPPESTPESRDGPTCALDGTDTAPHYSYYVELITEADLQEWVDGAYAKPVMITEAVQVEEYPALLHYAQASSPSDCEALVGIAEDQTLRAQLYPLDPSEFSQEQMCELAQDAAAFAVQTLQATG